MHSHAKVFELTLYQLRRQVLNTLLREGRMDFALSSQARADWMSHKQTNFELKAKDRLFNQGCRCTSKETQGTVQSTWND